jgi:hypothetical protein
VVQVELPARSHGGQLLGKAVQMVNRRCVGHEAILVWFRQNLRRSIPHLRSEIRAEIVLDSL